MATGKVLQGGASHAVDFGILGIELTEQVRGGMAYVVQGLAEIVSPKDEKPKRYEGSNPRERLKRPSKPPYRQKPDDNQDIGRLENLIRGALTSSGIGLQPVTSLPKEEYSFDRVYEFHGHASTPMVNIPVTATWKFGLADDKYVSQFRVRCALVSERVVYNHLSTGVLVNGTLMPIYSGVVVDIPNLSPFDNGNKKTHIFFRYEGGLLGKLSQSRDNEINRNGLQDFHRVDVSETPGRIITDSHSIFAQMWLDMYKRVAERREVLVADSQGKIHTANIIYGQNSASVEVHGQSPPFRKAEVLFRDFRPEDIVPIPCGITLNRVLNADLKLGNYQ
ncbi:MAG: hypothetical protein AABX33_02910 [Nanoarchaeota archaeon]